MKITNKSPGLQGINTADGEIVWLKPGETRDLDVSQAEMTTLEKHRFLQFGDAPAEEEAASGDGRDENGDTPEMAEMRKRLDASYAQVAAEIDRLNAELAGANATIKELRQSQASAPQEPANPAEGEQDPPKPTLSVKDKGRGWNVIVDAEGKELTKSLRDDAVAGFDAKSDEDKAAFVDANKAD